MKIIVEYDVDNSDGFYNLPAEKTILSALEKGDAIHGFRNIKILIDNTMMSKYIDAEKLKIEIERRAKSIDTATGDFAEGRKVEQRAMLSFIDFLQQEQQAVEGVVHHVTTAHYIVTNQEQLNARLREIPEGTKVNILISEAEEESK